MTEGLESSELYTRAQKEQERFVILYTGRLLQVTGVGVRAMLLLAAASP